MTAFIYAVLAMMTVEMMAKIISLAIGFPPRYKAATVIDITIAFGMIVWGTIVVSH